jgi:hypothetical protein
MLNAKYVRLLLVVILALASASLVWYATAWGIGTSPDSVAYIGAARNLAAGRGLTVPFGGLVDGPMTHHAPLYPALLSTFGFTGSDPANVARFLGSLIMAANVLLAAFLVRRMLPSAIWPPILAGLLVAISPTLLEIHSMAWSEPMFIFLGFIGLAFLAEGLEKRSWMLVVASALLIGLAVLTRYAGLALIATGGAGILLYAHGSRLKRLVYAAGYAIIAVLLLAIWSMRNATTGSASLPRSLNFHLIERSQLWQGMATTTSWLLMPENAPTPIHLVALGLLGLVTGAVILWLWRQRRPVQPVFDITWGMVGLFIPVYGFFLLLSISFFDANTPLDSRILSPLYFASVIILVVLFSRFAEASQTRFWRVALLGCTAMLVVGYGQAALPWLRSVHQQGIGFSAVAWQQSPVMAKVRDLPAGILVYTNAPEAIYFNGNHRALRLPRSFETVSQQANPNYAAEIAAAQQQLATRQAVVVFFTHLGRQVDPSEAELVEELSLELLAALPDGNLYSSRAATGGTTP